MYRQDDLEFIIIVVVIIGGQGDRSCRVGRAARFFGTQTGYYCSARVITASLQANARKFGQRGCCLKCFTVWLSHAHYVSHSVSSCFHRVLLLFAAEPSFSVTGLLSKQPLNLEALANRGFT